VGQDEEQAAVMYAQFAQIALYPICRLESAERRYGFSVNGCKIARDPMNILP